MAPLIYYRILKYKSYYFNSISFLLFVNIFCCLSLSKVVAEEEKINIPELSDSSNYVIVVSSRKSKLAETKESLNSISNIQGKSEIDKFKRQDLTELSNSLPGLNYAGGTSRPRFFQLRGVGERELFEGIPANSVRIIYDEIDFSGISSAINLFDLDEIATFYGPQSFAVGPSAYAGAVSIHSVDPTSYNTGRLQIGAGTNEAVDGGLAVGGKILSSETTNFRLSVNKNYVNGFRRNVFLERGDTNERDGLNFRFKVDTEINDSTKGEFMYLFSEIKDGYDAFTIDNNLTTESDRPGSDTQKTNAFKFKLINNLDIDTELTNIFAYVDTLQHTSFDVDFGNEKLWFPYVPYDYTQEYFRAPKLFSHELRFKYGKYNPLKSGESLFEIGTFSAYRGDRTNTDDYYIGQFQNSLRSKFRVTEFAPITRFQYTLSPQVVVDLGGRIEQRNLEFNDSRNFSKSKGEYLLGANTALRYYKDKIAKDYYYTSISRGEKPSGVNPGLSLQDERKTFDSEKLWNFEIGSEDTFYDGDLSTSFALFYGLRKSQQVRSVSQPDPSSPSSFTLLTENAASGNLYGIDSEAVIRVTDSFRVRINGELLRTNIYNFETTSGSLNGRDQSHAPNWSYSTAGDYVFSEKFYIGSRITGKGSFYFDEPNLERSTPYHLVDAHIGYTTGNWNIELWGRNIFDKKYENRGFYFGSEPPNFENKRYVQLGDPAWFGVTMRYDW